MRKQVVPIHSAPENRSQAILQALSNIPYGKVCTYGGIAKRAGQPGGARYVGYVLRSLPSGSNIPWHRVINGQGRSSFPLGSARQQLQFSLLESEGIDIMTRNSDRKISLKNHLWL